MSLKCQRDSYLRSVSARVVACDPCAPGAGEGEGEAERYRVTLEDTVLFPGGGGQVGGRGWWAGLARSSHAVCSEYYFLASLFFTCSSCDG